MKKKRYLFEYLRHRIKILLILLLFSIVFEIVFLLYNLPPEAVIYAAILCSAIGLVVLAYDYCKYARRHSALQELRDYITLGIDALPQPKALLEADYLQLIQAVHNDKIKIITRTDNERTDLIDYFTLWAHQIKTPIAAMRLLLQSAESSQNSELSMELFKIEQYVEMVLGYLRLDSSSTDYVLKKYNLGDIVRQAVRKYARVFISKKIALDLKDTDIQVLTDEKWLLFVIEQLLSNALKYTNEGKISINVENGSTLVIEDTGIGIQPEDLPRVFEKGFTGYNGRTYKKSTGIGLYLCKRVMKKLGHGISIASEVGKGTAVRLELDSVNILVE